MSNVSHYPGYVEFIWEEAVANILIIGASSGIGLELARQLSGNNALWTTSRNLADEVIGQHILWDASNDFPADLLPDTLDGFVYCPGSIRLQPFERSTDQHFLEDLDLNLLGGIRAFRAALPALKNAEKASAVFYSTVAVTTGMPMHSSIAAAKGAVEGLSRSLAAELAPKIRVNAIAPSLTETRLSKSLLRTERQKDAAAGRHPMECIGQPEDIASMTRFLLSDDSSWVTGQVFHVDGGLGAIRTFK
jgi:NAD(P)-dependent dehydrogenase (short-subunit alcohol dehydrogenase family)